MIRPQSVEAVLEASRIEEVVRDYVDLKHRGSNLIGLCPFHKEKTPSFSISPSKNIFKCFGCGKGGTPLQFVMEAEHMSFPEAIRHLAKKYQITLEETHSEDYDPEIFKEQESLHVVNQFALKFYQNQMWQTPTGQSVGLGYFKERGYLEQTIERFELGFAPDESDALCQTAIKEGFKLEYLQKLGLVTAHQRDFFRNRVIFPIHNLTGKPIAFAGRILTSDPKAPKYVNSPETELYQKSKTLYGLHLARKAIREKNSCILVEGYTDVMSLHQAGFENCVASSGTSLTEEQVQAIKRITPNTVILYDGDPAGIKASLRGIDLLIQEGLNVRIALIPGREDPDSFIKSKGAQAFETFLETEAVDFILFKLQQHVQDSGKDPLKKSQAAQDIIKTIAKVDDPVKRSIYLKQTAAHLQLDELPLIEACNQLIREELRNRHFQEKRNALERDKEILKELEPGEVAFPRHHQLSIKTDEFQEKDICRILMLWGHKWYDEDGKIPYASYIIENISDTIPFFENDFIRQLILDISGELSSGRIPDLNFFLNHPNKKISELALDLSLSKHEYSSNWEARYGIFLNTQDLPERNYQADITYAILRFKLKKYNKAIEEFEAKLKENSLSEEALEIELKSHLHIVNERNYIAGLLNTVVI